MLRQCGKRLKLKVRKFLGLIPTLVEVTEEKLVGGFFVNKVKRILGLKGWIRLKRWGAVVFLKLCFLERGCNPDFLWLVILSQVRFFLKISLNFIELFRRYIFFSILTIFVNFMYIYKIWREVKLTPALEKTTFKDLQRAQPY